MREQSLNNQAGRKLSNVFNNFLFPTGLLLLDEATSALDSASEHEVALCHDETKRYLSLTNSYIIILMWSYFPLKYHCR